MADTPDTANLNVQQDDVQVIQAPARSVPGGGVQTMDGPIRSVPGGATEQLGGDIRQGANQQGKPDAAAAKPGVPPGNAADDAGAGGEDGAPGAGAAANAGAEQQEGDAGGEGRTAALEAALAALPEETRTALDPFSKEYQETGKLEPASVTAAAAALGVPESLVAFHLAAVSAATPAPAPAADPVQAELVAAAHEVAGGAEAYAPFRAWLKSEGRTDDEALLGEALAAKSPGMLKRLMAPLVAEFKASGAAPNTRRDITSEAAQGEQDTGAIEGFATQAEMIAAQREPNPKNPRKTRYASDPEFRSQVNKRIAASDFSKGKQR